jgi:hypothetical protein
VAHGAQTGLSRSGGLFGVKRTSQEVDVLTPSQVGSFERNGFVCIRNVFSREQIQQLRRSLIDLFDSEIRWPGDVNGRCESPGHPARSVRFDIFARNPELSWVLTHPPLVAALSDLVGPNFVILPDNAAHDGGFGRWHKDTHEVQTGGHMFHWEPDFRILQVGVYMQDNTLSYGGGLDAIPGSHLCRELLHPKLRERPRWSWFKGRVFGPCRGSSYPIPGRAGDLVVFHLRTEHKATWPRVYPFPPEHRKLAMFFPCSPNNRHVRSYLDFIHSMPIYGFLKTHQYPEALYRAARQQQVTLL